MAVRLSLRPVQKLLQVPPGLVVAVNIFSGHPDNSHTHQLLHCRTLLQYMFALQFVDYYCISVMHLLNLAS